MMRIRSLTIKAFRGISGSIDLDLSAPITVLYAPNGTGKTTVCDAVEWLLTGGIKRLQINDPKLEIRCAFSKTEDETLVSGDLDIEGEQVTIERTLDACRWKVGTGKLKKVTQTDLLAKIAPSAVEDGAHTIHANNSRQIWLRGTRFLSGDALSTLVDPDESAVSSRERVFADLLGVGHLLETERQLDNYIGVVAGVLKNQQEKVDEKVQAINARILEDSASTEIEEARVLPEIWNRVRQAREFLNAPQDIEGEQQEVRTTANIAISALRVSLDSRKLIWNEKRQAELNLAPDWVQRDTLQQETVRDQARLVQIGTEGAAKAEEQEKLVAVIKELTEKLAATRAGAQAMEQLFIDVGAGEGGLLPALKSYLDVSRIKQVTVKAIKAIAANGRSAKQRAERVSLFRRIATDLPITVQKAAEVAAARARAAAALEKAPPSDAVASIDEQIRSVSQKVAQCEAAYAAASGPVDRLKHLTATVVNTLDHDSSCPVCTQNWATPAALKAAIQKGRDLIPEGLLSLQNALLEAENEIKQLAALSEVQKAALSEAVDAQRNLTTLERELLDRQKLISEAGLDPADAALSTAVSVELAICELAVVAAPLLERLDQLTSALPMQDADFMILGEVRQFLTPIVKGVLDDKAAELSRLQKELEVNEPVRKTIGAALSSLSEEREALVRRIRQTAGRLQTLSNAWQTLAADRPWSDDNRDLVISELRQEFEADQQVERLLAQASDLLATLDGAEEVRGLRASLVPLVEARDRLNQYSETAVNIRDAYQTARFGHIKNQMCDFVKIISALFTRMQANLVFDEVVSGQEDAPLSWKAIADTMSLDPKVTFSQGQRQDFALAIFLARARGLGGTFMLDEPVNHLDDLNRVALLDVFRAIALEADAGLSFVLTTANKPFVRHVVEKFSRVSVPGGPNKTAKAGLVVVEMEGNPRAGVTATPGSAAIFG